MKNTFLLLLVAGANAAEVKVDSSAPVANKDGVLSVSRKKTISFLPIALLNAAEKINV